MPKLIGTDVPMARCAAPGWMRWAHSSRDGLVHAFPTEDSQRGRWPRAVCSSTVPPAALGADTMAGPRCPRCVLALAAARAAPRRPDRPGLCAWLLGCWRRHRHDPQPAPLAQVPDITLPPTTAEPTGHERRARGVTVPARDTASGLVAPPLVCHDPGTAR